MNFLLLNNFSFFNSYSINLCLFTPNYSCRCSLELTKTILLVDPLQLGVYDLIQSSFYVIAKYSFFFLLCFCLRFMSYNLFIFILCLTTWHCHFVGKLSRTFLETFFHSLFNIPDSTFTFSNFKIMKNNASNHGDNGHSFWESLHIDRTC